MCWRSQVALRGTKSKPARHAGFLGPGERHRRAGARACWHFHALMAMLQPHSLGLMPLVVHLQGHPPTSFQAKKAADSCQRLPAREGQPPLLTCQRRVPMAVTWSSAALLLPWVSPSSCQAPWL